MYFIENQKDDIFWKK